LTWSLQPFTLGFKAAGQFKQLVAVRCKRTGAERLKPPSGVNLKRQLELKDW